MASPSKPKIKIPVHVFVYSIAFLPGAAYAYYWYKNAPTDEQQEEILRQKYSHHIQSSREKHETMSRILLGMNDPNNVEQQKVMDELLKGGKGDYKRLHAVDKSLYGTEEGARLRKDAIEKSNAVGNSGTSSSEKRKKKKKKTDVEENFVEQQTDKIDVEQRQEVIKQSVAVAAVLGLLAVGASVFLGGRRLE